MREIKFRIFIDGMGMFYDVGIMNDEIWAKLDDKGYDGIADKDNWASDISPLMQYTGLKDINGVKIYEGDIVKIPIKTASEYWTVEWHEAGFVAYNGLNTLINLDDIELVADINNTMTYNIEILGNIHENKELLDE